MQQQGKTLVVGLGEVGGALSQVLQAQWEVLGHDIEPVEISDPISVMHLCIPCTRQGQFISTAVSYIKRFKPELTIINSTVVPGTSRVVSEVAGVPVAYSPIRGKHIRMAQDLMHYVKFISATDPDTARRAEEHFCKAGMKTRCLSGLESLELAKLAETTYFGVLIAFAQELNRYATRINGDYEQACSLFEEVDFLPHTHYFPGFIGGHCVIPNIHLLQAISRSPLLEAVLESNRRRGHELQTNGAKSAATHDRSGGRSSLRKPTVPNEEQR